MLRWFAAILFLMAGALPASAAVRDDVMGGAFRCAAAGTARQWLDCYYGAAQPMRASLSLPPAPASQQALAAAPPQGAALQGDAARARDEVMSQAFHCTQQGDDRKWLDCYYAAAQPMRAFLNLSPAPQTRAPLPPSNPAPTRPVLPHSDAPIVSRLAAYHLNSAGIFTVTLENGETWRQIAGDTAFAKFALPAPRYVATIRKGFFGSYNMTIPGMPGLFRVRPAP